MLRRTAMAALVCLALLAGCTPGEGADGDPPSPAPSDPVPLSQLMTPTAADGGRIEIVESAITPFKDEIGRDTFAWAMGVKNTSTTDLLVSSLIDRVFTYSGDKAEDFATEKVYSILPGQTVYQGNNTSGGAAPAKMTPVVKEARWIPLAALDTRGKAVGVEPVGGELVLDGEKLTARASFTSNQANVGPLVVYLQVVFRDSKGRLLGGMWSTSPFQPTGPGPHEVTATFKASDWLPGADESTSTATVYAGCCSI